MRTLLIDAMGTLLALEPPVEPLRAELARRFGVDVSATEAEVALRAEIAFYRAHMARGRDAESVAGLRRACGEALLSALPARVDVDAARMTDALLAALRFRAYADAVPALTAARAAGVERVVVVSNWDASLPEVIERVGLASHVDAVVTSAQVGAAKPSAAIFASALARVRAVGAHAVHVGDSLAEDIAGARSAGLAGVLLDRSGAGRGAGAAVPVIAGLDELPEVLKVLGASDDRTARD